MNTLATLAVRALLVCSVVACTGRFRRRPRSRRLRDIVEMYGSSAMTCEAPCAEPPENYTGSGEQEPCSATHPDSPGITRCDRTFEFDDLHGCCMIADDRVTFWQCE